MKSAQAEKAKKIIANNIYMTIATATGRGKPWITPVWFAYDPNYVLYFVSAKDSKHSKLISKNNRVAVVIYDSSVPEGTGDGVYLTGNVFEVSCSELEHAIDVVYSRKRQTHSHSQYDKNDKKVRTAKDFTGDSPWRMYKIMPRRFWTLKDYAEVRKHPVDLREETKLSD